MTHIHSSEGRAFESATDFQNLPWRIPPRQVPHIQAWIQYQ